MSGHSTFSFATDGDHYFTEPNLVSSNWSSLGIDDNSEMSISFFLKLYAPLNDDFVNIFRMTNTDNNKDPPDGGARIPALFLTWYSTLHLSTVYSNNQYFTADSHYLELGTHHVGITFNQTIFTWYINGQKISSHGNDFSNNVGDDVTFHPVNKSTFQLYSPDLYYLDTSDGNAAISDFHFFNMILNNDQMMTLCKKGGTHGTMAICYFDYYHSYLQSIVWILFLIFVAALAIICKINISFCASKKKTIAIDAVHNNDESKDDDKSINDHKLEIVQKTSENCDPFEAIKNRMHDNNEKNEKIKE